LGIILGAITPKSSYQMKIKKNYFLKTRNILVPTKMATAAAIAPITIYCSKLPAIFNRIIATTFPA